MRIVHTLLFILNTIIINLYLILDYCQKYRLGKLSFCLLVTYMIVSSFVFGELVLKKSKNENKNSKRNTANI
jgi:hypothetical protein